MSYSYMSYYCMSTATATKSCKKTCPGVKNWNAENDRYQYTIPKPIQSQFHTYSQFKMYCPVCNAFYTKDVKELFFHIYLCHKCPHECPIKYHGGKCEHAFQKACQCPDCLQTFYNVGLLMDHIPTHGCKFVRLCAKKGKTIIIIVLFVYSDPWAYYARK